jgi:phosphate-selective porin OprO and OprP
MKHAITLSLLATSSLMAAPTAMAQEAASDADAIQAELSAMRASMEAMNRRIEELEAELALTRGDDAEQPVAADVPVAAPVPVAAKEEPQTQIAWKGAPVISHPDGWSFKPRGRFNYDAAYISAPKSTGHDDGYSSEARRIRLGIEGTVPGGFGYKAEFDFAQEVTVTTDAYIDYTDGNLTIIAGQHNTFQSMEELSSSLHTSFIERAAFTDAFVFERRVGISAQYITADWLVQAGFFTDNIEVLRDNKNAGGDIRFAYMPKVGDTQLHIGGSVHYNDIEDDGLVRYRQRPLEHPNNSRFIDTGFFSADSETGLGVETSAIMGPFHVAGEAFWQHVERTGFADPTFFGGYAEVGYFLTPGDRRGYKKGLFDRIRPANPVNEGGMGALQVNLRYDYLDLDDVDITGGQQNLYGISLIWTPTDYTRFLLNYAYIEYDGAVYPTASGDTSYGVNTFGARAQLDF